MRKLFFLLALSMSVTTVVGVNHAAAQEYPWCLQGKGVSYPGDCNYQTRAQCQASASGRNVGCGINPRAWPATHPSRRSQLRWPEQIDLAPIPIGCVVPR